MITTESNTPASPVRRYLSLLAGTVLVAAPAIWFLITFRDRKLMAATYSHAAYWLVTLLVALWAYSAIRLVIKTRPAVTSWIRSAWPGLVTAALLCGVVWTSVPHIWRTLADESNVMNVANSMFFEKRVDNVTEGYRPAGLFVRDKSREFGTEKHHLLFPYLTHLLHTVRGFAPQNAFLLNTLLLFALLVTLYGLCLPYWGRWPSLAVQVMIASQPLVSQYAVSGGVDVLAFFWLVATFGALKLFLEDPECSEKGSFFLMTTAMLVHSRQEMPLPAVVLMAPVVLWILRHPSARGWLSSWTWRFMPLVMLPIAWHRLLVKDPFEQKGREVAFSLANIAMNHIRWARTMIKIDYYLPYATFAIWIGLVGLAVILYKCVTHLRRQSDVSMEHRRHRILVFSAFSAILCHWLIITAFYRGTADHPTNARYFLPFVGLISVAAVWALMQLEVMKKFPQIVLGVAVLSFAVYHPVAVRGEFCNLQTAVREYRYVSEFLKKNVSPDALIISERPVLYTALGRAAISFSTANREKQKILREFSRHEIGEIWVIQHIRYSPLEPAQNNVLDPVYRFDFVDAVRGRNEEFIQILKVYAPEDPRRGDRPGGRTAAGTTARIANRPLGSGGDPAVMPRQSVDPRVARELENARKSMVRAVPVRREKR